MRHSVYTVFFLVVPFPCVLILPAVAIQRAACENERQYCACRASPKNTDGSGGPVLDRFRDFWVQPLGQ